VWSNTVGCVGIAGNFSTPPPPKLTVIPFPIVQHGIWRAGQCVMRPYLFTPMTIHVKACVYSLVIDGG